MNHMMFDGEHRDVDAKKAELSSSELLGELASTRVFFPAERETVFQSGKEPRVLLGGNARWFQDRRFRFGQSEQEDDLFTLVKDDNADANFQFQLEVAKIFHISDGQIHYDVRTLSEDGEWHKDIEVLNQILHALEQQISNTSARLPSAVNLITRILTKIQNSSDSDEKAKLTSQVKEKLALIAQSVSSLHSLLQAATLIEQVVRRTSDLAQHTEITAQYTQLIQDIKEYAALYKQRIDKNNDVITEDFQQRISDFYLRLISWAQKADQQVDYVPRDDLAVWLNSIDDAVSKNQIPESIPTTLQQVDGMFKRVEDTLNRLAAVNSLTNKLFIQLTLSVARAYLLIDKTYKELPGQM